MQLDLADTLWARLHGRPAYDADRQSTQSNLAVACGQANNYSEAETLYRDILATLRRMHDPNERRMLAGNLAGTLL